MKRLKNLSKKDWVIFWAFAFLIANVIGNRFNHKINHFLFQFSDPYLSQLNAPQSYGRLIAASFLLFLTVEVVFFLLHKSLRAKIVALVGGIFIPLTIAGIYFTHCHLITSVLWDTEPITVCVDYCDTSYYIKTDSPKGIQIPSQKELDEILTLCRNLTPITDEDKKQKCMYWYENAEEPFLYTDRISLYYAEKYGHHYQFTLRLHEGYVYLWRGNDDITFFEDNGLMEWVESICKR